jgi:hypothetical protein
VIQVLVGIDPSCQNSRILIENSLASKAGQKNEILGNVYASLLNQPCTILIPDKTIWQLLANIFVWEIKL